MKSVLITGGSRGIGAACVKKFCERGWNVYFTYNKSAQQAMQISVETGAQALQCDVSDKTQVEGICKSILAGGGVDCIVNNAGIAQQKLFTDITENDWDRMFDVNVKGMFFIISAFAPHLINKKCGSIVNISSVWGIDGGSCEVHYSASKAAVIGFTKALAAELGPSGIRVNCVAPGVIDTDMNRCHGEETMDMLRETTPLCRIGKPGEVAETVFYLCENGSFITGEVIRVSGGF